jgi:plastocyanin
MPNLLRSGAVAGSLLVLAQICSAEEAAFVQLELSVADHAGAPVPEVAVYLTALARSASASESESESESNAAKAAAINQHELTFDPHLSIIETGTAVRFLNEDAVNHHVFSFSAAKQLNLQVASQAIVEPRIFDRAGLVTLGCNIHDDMLAYILVVDTPHFGKTTANGIVEFAGLAPGLYELSVWTPRVKDSDLPDTQVVEIGAGTAIALKTRFEAKLRPPHDHSETSLQWTDY